jgi:hypothetical protein
MIRVAALVLALSFAAIPASSQETGKDQSQVLPDLNAPAPPKTAAPSNPPAAGAEQPAGEGAQPGEDLTSPDDSGDAASQDNEVSPDEMSLGEIPSIQTIELTADIARRAVDTFALVRQKFKDSNLEEYENLQDFVDQTAEGKNFEADIKAHGFGSVNEWNTAITTVGFAYSALTDDQTDDIRAQIEEVKKDTSIAQDLKDRMISSLTAMIPSENNRKVVQAMMDEPEYSEKLKLLAEEE